MALYTRLEIIDRDGWRKEYRFEKQIILIGSGARNDLVLSRAGHGGVEAQHAQLMPSEQGYRLVNLSSTEIVVGNAGGRTIAPQAVVEVADGESLTIGDYTVFLGGGAGSLGGPVDEGTTEAIGVRLALAEGVLAPDRSLEGAVVVRNLGSQPRAQFKLEIENWDPEYFDVGPGPILYPNAEKEVIFRLRHPRQPTVPPGKHRFGVRVTAPEAYPGQSASVSQEIEILPFRDYTLRFVHPDQERG